MQSGQLPRAVKELRAFLVEQPFRAESWHLLGDVLELVGQRETATRAYAEAARRDVHDRIAAVKGETAR